jgi:signal peptidase I
MNPPFERGDVVRFEPDAIYIDLWLNYGFEPDAIYKKLWLNYDHIGPRPRPGGVGLVLECDYFELNSEYLVKVNFPLEKDGDPSWLSAKYFKREGHIDE